MPLLVCTAPQQSPAVTPCPFLGQPPPSLSPQQECCSHRARGRGKSESGGDEMPRRTLRLAGLVPGLPPSHPCPRVGWAPLYPAGTAFDFLVPCNVPL